MGEPKQAGSHPASWDHSSTGSALIAASKRHSLPASRQGRTEVAERGISRQCRVGLLLGWRAWHWKKDEALVVTGWAVKGCPGGR